MSQDLPPWVDIEAEKPRKPRTAKPKPKPVYPKLRVNIGLSGSAEFDLVGPDAAALLTRLANIDLAGVLELLDPQASGIEITAEVGITEPATSKRWLVDEAADVIESITPETWWLRT